MFKEGSYNSYFYFDFNFKQTLRHDPVHYIEELTPAFFKLVEEEPLTPVLAADSSEEDSPQIRKEHSLGGNSRH